MDHEHGASDLRSGNVNRLFALDGSVGIEPGTELGVGDDADDESVFGEDETNRIDTGKELPRED